MSVEADDRARAFVKPCCAKNQLLELLPLDAYSRIGSALEPVRLAADSVIFENGERAGFAYFPQDCVISMQCATRDGASVEFGMIGNEGALGIETLLESGQMHGRAVVTRAGQALRIPAQAFVDSFRRCDLFRAGLLRYYCAFNTQVIQRSICHRVHAMELQLCTWLLLMHDRSAGGELEFTHELIGGLLGGRREGVTIAVRRLRNDGLVRSEYRNLVILDHAGLEARSCECYGAIRDQYAHLIPGSCNRSNKSGAQADRWNPRPIAGTWKRKLKRTPQPSSAHLKPTISRPMSGGLPWR